MKKQAADRASQLAGLLPYLVLAIASVVLVISHTPVGAALSMDSMFYVSAGKNILFGNGIVHETYSLTGPEYEALSLWPPLYPMVVAGITWLSGLTNTPVVVGIAMFNVLALFVTLFLVLRISLRTAPLTASIFAAVAVALSPSIQIDYTYAWSETIFIPLCLAAYLFLLNHLLAEPARPLRSLLIAIVLLGLTTYTRYVGVVFFGTTALALLVYGHGQLVDRLRTAALASAAYLAILAPLFIRNYLLSGALSGGDRGVPAWSLVADLKALTWTLYLEFLNLQLSWTLAIIVLTAGILAWLLVRSRDSKERTHAQGLALNIALPFLFVGCYLAFLLVSRSLQTIDLDARMLSVVIPFIFIGLVNAYQWLSMRAGRTLAVLPFLLPLVAFSANAVYAHSSIISGWRDHGEPGWVLGVNYPSLTGRMTISLRGIREHFAPAEGDLVLTDVRRPIIVDHLFPECEVRQLPEEPSMENMALLEEPLGRTGIAILDENTWSQAFGRELEGRAEFFTITSESSANEFVVMKLPVKEQ